MGIRIAARMEWTYVRLKWRPLRPHSSLKAMNTKVLELWYSAF